MSGDWIRPRIGVIYHQREGPGRQEGLNTIEGGTIEYQVGVFKDWHYVKRGIKGATVRTKAKHVRKVVPKLGII